MQTNNIKRKTKRKTSSPVGRGGKRGKTSGRGTKGQKARAGRKLRPEIRDVIMRLPKLRGRGSNSFVSRFSKPNIVKLGKIGAKFLANESIGPKELSVKGFFPSSKIKLGVKILSGGGTLGKAVNITGCQVSVSARQEIEKAGGSIK